ncbi:MAG: PIG-L family deacetylase [Gammaproteobacteria bacterium]|nr:PIG-L family deacetylase [Gammaproteobacteria bacterium]
MELKDMLGAYASVKELSSFKNPLFVGPHPDDIEFGCGALISRLKNNGASIHFLIVTDGAAGTSDPNMDPTELKRIREEESRSSASFLGAETIDFIGLEDGGIYSTSDVTREVSKYILKYNPDIVFSVDPNLRSETHPDHIKVGDGVRHSLQIVGYPIALKRHGVNIDNVKVFPKEIVLAYYFTDEPNTYAEVSLSDLEKKIASLTMHKSQFLSPESMLLLEYFKLKAQLDGAVIGKPFAESYLVLHPLLQHVYSLGTNIK